MPSCYAVGAEKALIQAALRACFSRGKGFIPKPSKLPSYCVTNDVLPILSCHVETVVLLSKLNTKQHIEAGLNLDELDLTAAGSKAT